MVYLVDDAANAADEEQPWAAGAADASGEETEMIDPRRFDDLARRIQASLPPGLDEVREDVTRNIRAVIAAGIARMDLVEREEFDVQSAVLARTREKLEALEHRVRQLEETTRRAGPRLEIAGPRHQDARAAGARKASAPVG